MSHKVYAPNIHLFAFQLRENGDDWLWQKTQNIIQKTLEPNFDIDAWLDLNQVLTNRRLPLIKAEKVKDDDFSIPVAGNISVNKNKDTKIKGFVYPIQIYDSYGVWLNLRRPEKDVNGQKTEDVDIQLLSNLNPDNCFIWENRDNFLGETLVITAWLTPENNYQDQQTLQKIADECLQAFFPQGYTLPLFQVSVLFGSYIFEYGLSSQLPYHHILVWLFRTEEADEKLNNCYQELLDLFFFRAKIVKAFQKSRDVYHQANTTYQDIETNINKLENLSETIQEKELEALKEEIKILPKLALDYATLLRYLEDYQNTISINTSNYIERIEQIYNKFPEDDLSFLETFTHQNCPYFQRQIQADLNYSRHGSSLVDKNIAAIRAIVEIEQAKSDRLSQQTLQQNEQEEKKRAEKLQNTIQAVAVSTGIGIGSAGVIASSYPLIEKPWQLPSVQHPLLPPHPFVASVFLSLVWGLGLGSLAGYLIKLYFDQASTAPRK